MFPNSIRWRLPISYAAIALLAALSLGAVLVSTVRGYYVQREQEYLIGNARAIANSMAGLIEADAPRSIVQSQLDNFAFLSQTRVRLLDANGVETARSDAPAQISFGVAVAPPSQVLFEREIPITDIVGFQSFIVIGSASPVVTAAQALPEFNLRVGQAITPPDVVFFGSIPVGETPYGFGLNVEALNDTRRSDQVAREPMRGGAGAVMGAVELSNGPAYGLDIVDSVTRGWAMAGLVAIAVAAMTGWIISRRITTPVLALTEATARMARGDLSARAGTDRRDEFGALARSFNEMADRVEDTVGTLRRFAADAAHELKTPLTALRTDLELAARDNPVDYLAQAQAQVTRLDRLSGDLLDLSRLEARTDAGDRVLLDLVDLVRRASEPFASRAEQAGIAFALDLPEESVFVNGDEEQLQRALGNLLDNAIKFTPAGGTVRVGLREESGHVSLWVEDTGIGVPADDMPQLFERFHRGRNSSAYPGSGLGLAIVKAIVDRHDGQVSVENLSPGARFRISGLLRVSSPISTYRSTT